MNFAHIHLIMNHIPVIGIPMALAFLIHGLWTNNSGSQRFALLVLFVVAALVIPVYLTGEPAEHLLKHTAGSNVTEEVISPHEEAAEVALILTIVTGVAAAGAIWFQKNEKFGRNASLGVVVLAVVALGSLVYTANLGGQIRHTELRADGGASASAPSAPEKEEKDDKD